MTTLKAGFSEVVWPVQELRQWFCPGNLFHRGLHKDIVPHLSELGARYPLPSLTPSQHHWWPVRPCPGDSLFPHSHLISGDSSPGTQSCPKCYQSIHPLPLILPLQLLDESLDHALFQASWTGRSLRSGRSLWGGSSLPDSTWLLCVLTTSAPRSAIPPGHQSSWLSVTAVPRACSLSPSHLFSLFLLMDQHDPKWLSHCRAPREGQEQILAF